MLLNQIDYHAVPASVHRSKFDHFFLTFGPPLLKLLLYIHVPNFILLFSHNFRKNRAKFLLLIIVNKREILSVTVIEKNLNSIANWYYNNSLLMTQKYGEISISFLCLCLLLNMCTTGNAPFWSVYILTLIDHPSEKLYQFVSGLLVWKQKLL